MAKKGKNDFYLYEKEKKLEQELDTQNIGMKQPDPSSHSNIAQFSEVD